MGWRLRRVAVVLGASALALLTVLPRSLFRHEAGRAQNGGQRERLNASSAAGAVRPGDFVYAIASHSAHSQFLVAGRAARQGAFRTYIAVEDGVQLYSTQNSSEVWATYPDDDPKRSMYRGDSRLAIVPFLAHEHFEENSFKWMLYGDDDTVFFLEAAVNVASRFDHNQPIFMSDNLWFKHHSKESDHYYHPHRAAPACLPCHEAGHEARLHNLGYSLAATCPCTPEALCDSIRMDEPHYRGCTRWTLYSHHGGAGALISIGLLRKIGLANFERCVKRTEAPGGDAFVAECLWLDGIAPTSPSPLWHPFRLQMFSPSPPALHTDEFLFYKARHTLAVLLMAAADVCKGLCQLELENTVSLHVRARSMGASDRGAMVYIRLFAWLTAKARRLEYRSAEDLDSVTSLIMGEIERELETHIGHLRLLAGLLKSVLPKWRLRPTSADFELRTVAGSVSLADRIQAGMADALAAKLLGSVRRKVRPMATWGANMYADEACR